MSIYKHVTLLNGVIQPHSSSPKYYIREDLKDLSYILKLRDRYFFTNL